MDVIAVDSTLSLNVKMENDVVTLVSDTASYEFSKKKLSEMSDYFNAMFNSDFVEKNKSVIKLEGVSANSLKHIWHFVTRGGIHKCPGETLLEEMLALLQAATMFQLTEIQERCSKILLDILDVDNAIPVLDIASSLDLNELIRKARAVALWNFDDVSKLDAFCKLSASQVEGLVSDPALHSWTGEWGVWEAIDRWVNSSEDVFQKRVVDLPKLVQCLHLESLTTSDLRCMALYESAKACPMVSKAIRHVITERVSSSRRNETDESGERAEESEQADEFIEEWRNTQRRKLPYVPAVVGNVRADPEAPSPYILRFCERESNLVPFLRLNKVENSLGSMVGFRVISNGSKLYMLGGEMMTRQSAWNHAVWTYDLIQKTWTFLSNLLRPSRHMSACCVGNDLYVIGGFGRHRVVQDSVCKLNLDDRVWTTCAPLPRPLYSVPCCVFRNQIYVIESVIHQYIPWRDVWTTLDVSPSAKGFANAMANEDFIFLSEAYTRNVYRLNPSDPSGKLELLGVFKNECGQACLIDEDIYSLSQDSFGEEMYCEKMSVRTGESIVLWEGTTGSRIESLSPQHRHGCFPLLSY